MTKKNNSWIIGAGLLVAFLLFIAVPFLPITVVNVGITSYSPYVQGNFYSQNIPAAQYLSLVGSKSTQPGSQQLVIKVYSSTNPDSNFAAYSFLVDFDKSYEFKLPIVTDSKSMIGIKFNDGQEVTIAHYQVSPR